MAATMNIRPHEIKTPSAGSNPSKGLFLELSSLPKRVRWSDSTTRAHSQTC